MSGGVGDGLAHLTDVVWEDDAGHGGPAETGLDHLTDALSQQLRRYADYELPDRLVRNGAADSSSGVMRCSCRPNLLSQVCLRWRLYWLAVARPGVDPPTPAAKWRLHGSG